MHDRVVSAHPSQRALASENVLDRHRALGGLVDQPGPFTKALSPFVAPVMAPETRPSAGRSGPGRVSRASPSRAPPNSWPAQDSASSPAPAASGATPAAGAWRRFANAYIYTALRVFDAACVRSIRTQLAARTLAGVCGLVDERLQQPAIAVETLEVVADRPCGPAQDVRQVAAADAGAQQPAHAGRRADACRPSRSRRRELRRRRALAANPTPPSRHARSLPAVGGRQRARRRAGAHAPERVPDPALLVGHPPAPAPTEPRRPCRTSAAGATGSRQRRRGLPPRGRPTPRSSSALPPAASIAAIERFTDTIGDLPEASNALDTAVQHIAQSEVAPRCPTLNLHARVAKWLHEVQRKVMGHGQS